MTHAHWSIQYRTVTRPILLSLSSYTVVYSLSTKKRVHVNPEIETRQSYFLSTIPVLGHNHELVTS